VKDKYYFGKGKSLWKGICKVLWIQMWGKMILCFWN